MLFFLFLPGCGSVDRLTLAPDAARAPAPPLPPELASRFAYERKPVSPRFERVEDEDAWEKVRGSYETDVPGKDKPWKVVFEFWRTKLGEGPRPVVVIIPILAGKYAECDYLGRLMARNGMHAFFVWREDNLIPMRGIDDPNANDPFELKLRRCVVNVRRTLDWVLDRPDVDPTRVGLVGISMGAIAGTVTIAAEPRIRAGVLLMGGGDLPSIVCESLETPVRRYKIHKMRELGIKDDERFKALISRALVSDPLVFAPYVGAERVQQYITKYDNKVPTRYQWKLWEALGKPEAYAIPIGHYTAIFYVSLAEKHAIDFLRRRLDFPALAPPAGLTADATPR